MIAAIHPGAGYHCEALEGVRYAGFFHQLIRPENLDRHSLVGVTTLLVPCRTPPARIAQHRALFTEFLVNGGTLVAMGETFQNLWLDDVRFTPVGTNYWWWLTPGADLGVRIAQPDHPLMAGMTTPDVTWHLHGWYEIPDSATGLVVDADHRPVLYVEDRGRGRLVVSSLDPFYHHGSHFMPATTRFLDRFLPNLVGWS